MKHIVDWRTLFPSTSVSVSPKNKISKDFSLYELRRFYLKVDKFSIKLFINNVEILKIYVHRQEPVPMFK